MMDVLAGVLTGSHFGSKVVGPYEADKISGAGHMLITIDVKSMMPADEFEERMKALIDDVKSVPTAHGVDEIFFPGEIEERNSARLRESGITLADNTWQSMQKLAAESGVSLPENRVA
jgi:LDH2 family malate/lactate/ureidoglycolate dehydrogenase